MPWDRQDKKSGTSFVAFLGGTERAIPRSRPAFLTAGRADRVKEAPRRRRGCLDPGEHQAMLGKQLGGLHQSAMACCRRSIRAW